MGRRGYLRRAAILSPRTLAVLYRGLVGLFIFLNFASEKKQIQYLWSYVDRLGGVSAPASMENRACLVTGLSTRWLTPSV